MEKLPKPPSLRPDDPALEKFSLFAGLGPEALGALLKLTATVVVPGGEAILREGEPGDCLFVIVSGSARVTSASPGNDIFLAALGPGDFFGEVSLVDEGPRSATVTATDPCLLIRVTRTAIGVLAGLHPEVAVQILSAIGSALVGRLRASNQKYLDVLLAASPHGQE